MRLGLLFVLALTFSAVGCGGSSNYMLPVDSPVYPYEKPEAQEFEAEAPVPTTTDSVAPTYDEDLLDEEVGGDDDEDTEAPTN